MVVVFDPDTQNAMRTPPDKRSPLQRQLSQLAFKQVDRKTSRVARRRLPPDQKERYEALQKKLAQFDYLKPKPLPVAMAVSDVGTDAPANYLQANGNYLKPREQVPPGFTEFLDPAPPAVRPPAGRPNSTGRRSALALWLTRPDHPLTGRVIVNRLWQHYFGQGIVATPNDFGVMGESPTHPELLDYLTANLTEGGWR